MIVFKGDLFDTKDLIVAYITNSNAVEDNGIASEMKNRYPKMLEEFNEVRNIGILEPGDIFHWNCPDRVIVNMVVQNEPGAPELRHVVSAAQRTLRLADEMGEHFVSIPKIGTGNDGLNWDDVKDALIQVERNRKSQFRVWEK